MSEIRIGALEVDPQKNPAVLDTGSWRVEDVQAVVRTTPEKFFQTLSNLDPVRPHSGGLGPFTEERLRVFPGSYAHCRGSRWFLAETPADGQRVLLEISEHSEKQSLSESAYARVLAAGLVVRVHPTDADTLHRYFQRVNPEKGPRALGAVPRLGVGVRHSVFMWPGALEAMQRGSFSANLIQNSVRELHMLKTLSEGQPSRENYLFSFGRIQEGHTGSTFEGLWVAGALAALSSDLVPRYGADADHIQVKRGSDGLDRAKQYLDASRYYSFYTLDISDVLNYRATWEFSNAACSQFLEEAIPDRGLRSDILAYHGKQRWLSGQTYCLDESEVGRLVGKYWTALDSVEQLVAYLHSIRGNEPFDLEISIDETPAEIATFDAITGEAELLFLMLEISRRGIPVTHLAPNFGIEKGTDYRGPDGLDGLAQRIRRLYVLASEHGFFLDCHSGDDLSRDTRLTVGRSTAGRVHFKVSPSLQVLFAQTLYDMYPQTFEWWWNDTLNWVRREAETGSSFAIDCLREFERSANAHPHPNHALFEHYNFATVGRRGADGSFENRARFYDFPAEFARELTRRVAARLHSVAEDVFDHPPG